MPQPPVTVLEVKDILRQALPQVTLDDPCRPVALIGHADGSAFSLSTDEDVEDLFVGTAYKKVSIEVQELFPRARAKPQIADFTMYLETAVCPEEVFRKLSIIEPPSTIETDDDLRKKGKPPPMAFGRRIADRRSVCDSVGHGTDLSSASKSSRAKAEPQAPARRARSLGRRPSQHDARIGRQMDERWSVVHDASHTTSGQMWDMAGIKKDFEDLEAATHERRCAMGRLLRPRWRAQQSDMVRPGLGSPSVSKLIADRDLGDPLVLNSMGSFKADPVSDNNAEFVDYALPALSGLQEMSLRSDRAFGQKEWLHDLGCVTKRDVPPLIAALESLSKLQHDMRTRLQDISRCATFHISNARECLSDDQILPTGGTHLGPRKTMKESPWMHVEAVGRVMIRLLPAGDAAAAADKSTIFVWAETPPLMTFTIEVGGIEVIAPRLWPKDSTHYRVEVPWRHVVSALAAAEATDDCLAVTFKVLQLYENMMPI